MNKIKYFPILDTQYKPKARKIRQELQKEAYSNLIATQKNKADFFLIGGGDGFMLDKMKSEQKYNKPFVGINCGTLGFLLNQYSSVQDIPTNKEAFDLIQENFIKIKAITKTGKEHIKYALNDLVIGNSVADYVNINIQGDNFLKKIQGTGLVLTTPIGSTGYRLNNNGPLLPLKSEYRGIMGLASNPFKYKAIEPQQIHISLTSRNPINCFVDGHAGKINNIEKIIITPTKNYVDIAFDKETNFEDKRIKLATSKI